MSLSSSIILHQTDEFEKLKKIIEEGFKIKYCYEKVKTRLGIIEAAVPMVSFCDIPLSEMKNHFDSYGRYGIGLNKSWAINKALNPVLYFDQESDLGHNLHLALRQLIKGNKAKLWEDMDVNLLNLIDVIRYMKNYEGDRERIIKGKKDTKKNYKFADEQEWRFVPSLATLKGKGFIQSSKNYLEDKEKYNKKLDHFRLEFTPKDIKYLIVESSNEVSELNDLIRANYKSSAFPADIEKILILKAEYIEKDF